MDFSSLCEKEIVDISTGEKLGYVNDVVFDEKSARILSLVTSGSSSWRLFSKGKKTEIGWSEISVIGNDTILVSPAKADDKGKNA